MDTSSGYFASAERTACAHCTVSLATSGSGCKRPRLRHGILAGLPAVRRVPGANTGQPPARLILECLRDREDDVLRPAHSPTSNQAERDVRPAKTEQKISGRLRPEQATRHRYAIRGYISTAAKHPRQHLHRPARRAGRESLDAAHPSTGLNPPSRHYAARTNITHK